MAPTRSYERHPNRRRKMPLSVEELRSLPAARDFTRMFRRWLEQTGRANRAVAAD